MLGLKSFCFAVKMRWREEEKKNYRKVCWKVISSSLFNQEKKSNISCHFSLKKKESQSTCTISWRLENRFFILLQHNSIFCRFIFSKVSLVRKQAFHGYMSWCDCGVGGAFFESFDASGRKKKKHSFGTHYVVNIHGSKKKKKNHQAKIFLNCSIWKIPSRLVFLFRYPVATFWKAHRYSN